MRSSRLPDADAKMTTLRLRVHSVVAESQRPAGLSAGEWPKALIVGLTTATRTVESAPLDRSAEAEGEYEPRRGQDQIVTSRWMRRLSHTTENHSWSAQRLLASRCNRAG